MITFLILRPDIISFWSDSLLKGPTLLNWEFKTSWIDLFPSSFNLNFLFKLTPDIFWQQNDFSQQTEFFKLIHFLEKFWLYLPLCIDNSTLQFDFRFRFTNETNELKFSYSTWYFRRNKSSLTNDTIWILLIDLNFSKKFSKKFSFFLFRLRRNNFEKVWIDSTFEPLRV